MPNKSNTRTVEDVLKAYADGLLYGLDMAIRAVQKLPRSKRSSIVKLIAAIKASTREEFGPGHAKVGEK